ncbi:MAG: polymer-forming cytoskeletal protein [Clostridia bacterium]|nr:polymer-forming cytoskeletal protein [Clostridia bacterium]
MKKTYVDGIGSLYGGSYDEVTVSGIGKLKGDLKANKLNVDGMFKSKGRIEADSFINDGMSRIYGDVKVGELRIDGMFKARCSKIEADSIYCDGIIVCTGEVSADNVEIEGLCSIAELYGDKIKIQYNASANNTVNIPGFFKSAANSFFGRPVSTQYSLVDTIECTDLEADRLKVNTIKANNVTLGPDCVVDYLECNGKLEIDPSCKIGKTNKDIKTESHNCQNSNRGTANTEVTIDKIIEDKNLDKTAPQVQEIIKKYQAGKITLNEVKLMLDALNPK